MYWSSLFYFTFEYQLGGSRPKKLFDVPDYSFIRFVSVL